MVGKSGCLGGQNGAAAQARDDVGVRLEDQERIGIAGTRAGKESDVVGRG